MPPVDGERQAEAQKGGGLAEKNAGDEAAAADDESWRQRHLRLRCEDEGGRWRPGEPRLRAALCG
jgi:hypothetical protein